MTKIEYNGSVVATVEGGNTATLPIKDKKMKSDIVITVPEAEGEVIPDHTQSDFTLQLANIASGELGVVYSSTEKVAFEAAPSGKVIDTFVDTNFVPNNIKKNIEIFGVTGIYEGEGGGDAVEFKIVVAVDSGATVTATKGSKKVSGTSVNGTCTLIVPEEGTWTVTATIDGVSATSQTVVVKSAFDAAIDYDKATLTIIADAGAVVTCSQGDITHTATIVDEPAIFLLYSFGEWALSATFNGSTKTDSISVAAGYTYTKDMSSGAVGALSLTPWETISEISAEGTAANYWAVGDTKTITINGTVGTQAISGNYKVYIIGFDHNSELEGTGIHFGTFKTEDDTDIALVDSFYPDKKHDGTKAFGFHHWNNKTEGGWSRSDIRYDILGSVNVPSSNYGKDMYQSSVGYDATETCATNPVADTLMAALPADLRAVMKPMTKYSNNADWHGEGGEGTITATIDYLPLLSEFELMGTIKYGATGESDKQQQYAYFAAGNEKSKVKEGTTTQIFYLLRSVNSEYRVVSYFHTTVYNSKYGGASIGIAPIFKV